MIITVMMSKLIYTLLPVLLNSTMAHSCPPLPHRACDLRPGMAQNKRPCLRQSRLCARRTKGPGASAAPTGALPETMAQEVSIKGCGAWKSESTASLGAPPTACEAWLPVRQGGLACASAGHLDVERLRRRSLQASSAPHAGQALKL